MNSDRAERRRTAILAADPTKPAKRLRFDRYVLDLGRGCLLLDESEIALRPKTFAVLHFLAQNCGRLVSKDELFAAVWPDLAVTDDTLVQSIGELRRALASDGSRLIRTVPRRGYRFEARVSQVVSVDEAEESISALPASPEAAQLPAPGGVRAPRTSFIFTHAGRHFRWVAALALAIVVAAGSLWSGIATDGRSPRNPELGAKPAIAVLLFINESDDATRGYFADGLAQDIISELGRFSELTVMSWNAVLPYRGKPAPPGEIARNLAVRYQVEGSVRQSDDRLRVSAQLVDADGKVLWSGRFDEALADLFALQDKITTRIVEAFAPRLAKRATPGIR
jgi:TolB-like protein/DNA-binding winged helix-turn-helix (wHTH) protein